MVIEDISYECPGKLVENGVKVRHVERLRMRFRKTVAGSG
jgi:hypothetical protein